MIRIIALAGAAALVCSAAQAADAPPKRPVRAPDTCGAGAWQGLIGKSKDAIPTAPAGAVWRVHSTDQMVTMDYVAGRMNIVWDAKTKTVIQVSCG